MSGDEVTGSMSKLSTDIEDKKTLANQLKENGNIAFKEQEYQKAVELYSQAIEADCTVAIYYSNRSAAYLKMEYYGSALSDASRSIELDKKYLKAYYRRADANMCLGKFKQALKDFEAVTKARPQDTDAKAKYTECYKIVQKIRFEKAIASDDQKSVSETIDVSNMAVESDYTGPHLENGKVTLEFMKKLMETFRKEGKLHRKYAYQILLDVKTLLMSLPTLVDINIPDDQKFTVCGDIHGQYYDLLNIFELNGIPSDTNPYLFNGDFVDRGSFSVECVLVLFGFKLLYPNHFHMARGNHESLTMNQMYGFEGEVKAKYTSVMWDLFTEVYNWLPLSHLLNNRVLVMHGGLFATENVTIDDIRKVNRNRQPPEDGLMCDLLWSDPQPQNGRCPSKRGVGIQFGPDVTHDFTSRNNLDYIIRSHEVKQLGYEVCHDGQCITVFSAPNYCDTMGNKGAFINMNGKTLKSEFTTYEAVPHPSVRPMKYANSLMNYMF